jgi:SAM-dependent methyltransferase
LVGLLESECGLTRDSAVADIGSGTGNLSRPFLENGNRVFGVEPNAQMRAAGERLLAGHGERFVSVEGTAEETGLPDASAGFVVAGQAFHWFDRGRAREEFGRILRPGGWVVLAWNERRVSGTAFLEQYEEMILDLGTDYAAVSHTNLDREAFGAFYDGGYGERLFENRQVLDLAGLRGRLTSTSYVPAEGEPGFGALMDRLEGLFKEHEEGGTVTVEYDCRVFYGRPSEGPMRYRLSPRGSRP